MNLCIFLYEKHNLRNIRTGSASKLNYNFTLNFIFPVPIPRWAQRIMLSSDFFEPILESFAASYVYLHFSTPKIVGNLGAFFDSECKIPLLKVECTSQKKYEYRLARLSHKISSMSIINWKNFLWYCIKFYSFKLFSIVWCKKICLYPTILSIKSRKICYLKVHKYTLNQYPKPACSKKPKKFRGSSQPLVWGWLILTYFWPIFSAMYNFFV